MSERSVYLRDQAEKCRAHAARMTDDEARQQLHVLAAEYIMRAVMIESDEPSLRTLRQARPTARWP
jgi:hypothetical protein